MLQAVRADMRRPLGRRCIDQNYTQLSWDVVGQLLWLHGGRCVRTLSRAPETLGALSQSASSPTVDELR